MSRSAKQMQQVTETLPKVEQMIRITARTGTGYEYHLTLPESAVRDLIDPEVADAFIEVPLPKDVHGAKKRYLHTNQIAEVDLHDDLPAASEDTAAPAKGDTGAVKAVKNGEAKAAKVADTNRGG
jgi:hypothetical protein